MGKPQTKGKQTSKIKKNSAKKMAKVEAGQAETQVDTERNKSPIHDLPPEMLKKILGYLDIKDLAVSRLVLRKWNEIASELLQSKSDLEIEIDCRSKNENSGSTQKNKKINLSDYIKCFGSPASKNVPYTRFLCHVQQSTFDEENWIKFVSLLSQNKKCLTIKLSIRPNSDADLEDDDSVTKVAEKLKQLLLNQHLKHLKEFGFEISKFKTSNLDSSKIQLFPNPTKIQATIQLPHFKILHLNEASFLEFTGIVTDLLQASINLQKIQPFYNMGFCLSISRLQLLESLGKLHCLQEASIELTPDFLTKMKQSTSKSTTPLAQDFKLKVLHLNLCRIYKNKKNWSDASSFLANLFESSKNTLREIKIDPLGFLHEVQLPKFTKVTKLCVGQRWFGRIEEAILPQGIKFVDTFPLLRCLELGVPWSIAFTLTDSVNFEDNSIISNLTDLQIPATGINKNVMGQISFFCPNLKDFKIHQSESGALENFPEVGIEIWTGLKKLKTLDLEINVDALSNKFPAIDSCITGFSPLYCKKLYEWLKLLKKQKYQKKIPQSELSAERKSPSILDLKDLKKLTIRLVQRYNQNENGHGEKWDWSAFISEEYAFKFMENLTYEIERSIE